MRRVIVGTEFDIAVVVEGNEPEPHQQAIAERRRRIAVGREFDATVNLTGDAAATTDALTRSSIVKAVALLAGAFLLGAAGLGVFEGNFQALQNLWGVVGPLYGGIASYFFMQNK